MSMIHRRGNWIAFCWAALLCAGGGDAGAQAPSDAKAQAEALFKEGKAALDAEKWADACPLLEESNRLDPGTGTQFRLAECYERTGKLASAWSLYVSVEAECRRKNQVERADFARAKATALEPRIPRLKVLVAPEIAGIDGIEVKRNSMTIGAPSWGRALPVDAGTHRIVAVTPGGKRWERTVEAVDGEAVQVKIEGPEDAPSSAAVASGSAAASAPVVPTASAAPARPAPPEGDKAGASEPSNPYFTAAVTLGAAGLAALAAGAGLGFAAQAKWNDATSECMRDSAGRPYQSGCPEGTAQIGNDAEIMAHGATVLFAAGGASLALSGVFLFLRQPSKPATQALSWAPFLSHDRAGLFVVGRF